MVFCGHLLGTQPVRPLIGKGLFFCVYGHQAVIAFFLLSGMVNRLSLERRFITWDKLLISRMGRLLPIYFIVVGVSFVIDRLSTGTWPWSALVGHVGFVSSLQGELFSPFESNGPLWSMSFEFWFYIFLALCLAGGKLSRACWVVAALGGIVVSCLGSNWPCIAWVAKLLGYSTVWLLGYYARDVAVRGKFSVALVGLLVGTVPAMSNLGLQGEMPIWFVAFGCMLWPLFINLSGCTSFRQGRIHIVFELLALAAVLSVIATLLMSDQPPRRTIPLVVCPLVTSAGAGFASRCIDRICRRHDLLINNLGRASYAVYLVHMPFIYLGLRAGLPPMKLLLLVCFGTALVSWFLEWKLQPKFNLFFAAFERRSRPSC